VTLRVGNRGAKPRRVRQRGSALLEQALTIILLLSVMFGIIDFARALYTYHFVANAAREASRWASVRSSTSSLGAADSSNVETLVSNVPGMGLDPANITSSVNWLSPPHGSPSCPANTPGCVVQVQVNYNFKFFFPFMPSSAIRMTSTSEMIITQ
jgi:Flp pilus assembly protein TadG